MPCFPRQKKHGNSTSQEKMRARHNDCASHAKFQYNTRISQTVQTAPCSCIWLLEQTNCHENRKTTTIIPTSTHTHFRTKRADEHLRDDERPTDAIRSTSTHKTKTPDMLFLLRSNDSYYSPSHQPQYKEGPESHL